MWISGKIESTFTHAEESGVLISFLWKRGWIGRVYPQVMHKLWIRFETVDRFVFKLWMILEPQYVVDKMKNK